MSLEPQDQAQHNSRPVSVVAVAVVFMAIGLLDIWRGAVPLTSAQENLRDDGLLVLSIGIAALLGGICALKGYNWARWLLTIWMALHVALSIRNPYALAIHVVIFGLALAGLFHPAASNYFRRSDG